MTQEKKWDIIEIVPYNKEAQVTPILPDSLCDHWLVPLCYWWSSSNSVKKYINTVCFETRNRARKLWLIFLLPTPESADMFLMCWSDGSVTML